MVKRFSNWLRAGTVAVLLTALGPVHASAETLADALADAYKHNGLIKQNRAVLRAADEDVAQAMADLRPVLNWAADVTRSFGNGVGVTTGTRASIGVEASWLLYDFGQTQMQVDIKKEAVLATRQALLEAEQSVLTDAMTAFMDVRSATEFVALRESNMRVLREELRAAKDRFELGDATRTDVSLAESQLASAKAGLAAAQGDLMRSVERFRQHVGRKPGNLKSPAQLPKLWSSVDEAKAYAVRHHPSMIKVQHQVTQAELGVLAAEAAVKPTIKLTGRLGKSETFDSTIYSNSGSIGVEAGGPIYQGGKISSAIRQARARRDEARAGLHVVRHAVQQNVGAAYAGLRTAQAVRRASDEQVRAAQVAFRGVREEAKVGSRTTLDVLSAEQNLLNARAEVISARVDEFIAAYNVLAATGQMTAEALRLNVPQYDPAAYYNMVKDAPLAGSKQGQQLDRVLKALGKD